VPRVRPVPRRSALPAPEAAGSRQLLIAAALLGGATLILEISLTRHFSVLLFYNYVFLVLAVALLGLGLGGALAATLPKRPTRAEEYAAAAATLAALFTAVAILLSAQVLPAGAPLLHAAVALLPFLATGVAVPLLFAARPGESGRIYGADLAGAAAGAAAVFGLLYLGAITAALAAAALYALAAWTLGRRRRDGRSGRTVVLAAAVALAFLNAATDAIDVDLSRLAAGKPLATWLKQGQATVIRSSWDPFSRVDVVRTPNNPLERLVFVDGAAGSPLPHYPADPNEETKRRTELGSFPYHLVQARRALVIGSGGGIGVLYALLDGVPDVTAVEVSPGVVDAVRSFGEYAGYLYDRPDVRVVTAEGRAFLDRDDTRYDVIDLSLVVSLATSQSGYALTENYLFTEEAFASVYAHLTDDGVAAVRLYDDPTLTRAFLTAATAIRRIEATDADAVRHLAVLFNPAEATTGSPVFYPMLLISKRPLTPEAAAELVARTDNLGYTVMYAPFTNEEGPFGKVARGEASLTGIRAELAGGVFTPTTDDRPFFFEMTGGLPKQLVRTWLAVAVIVLAAAVGLTWLARSDRLPSSAFRLAPGLGYFALLGVAFMLVELSLLARFALFLGRPTILLSVLLGGLLVAGGAGSYLSNRFAPARLDRVIVLAGCATAVWAVALPEIIDARSDAWNDWPLTVRIAAMLAALAPLGFAMGMLFPSGLRLASGDAALPWAVNGIASVVGSVLATTLAIRYGFTVVSFAGALLYVVVAVAGPALLGQPWTLRLSRRVSAPVAEPPAQ
jgi:hypothetical protein